MGMDVHGLNPKQNKKLEEFPVLHKYRKMDDDDEYENYFFGIVSDAVNDVLDRINKKINAGWAIVFYERDELFTLSFFKGKEEDRWKYQTLENYNDPTIH